MGRVGVSRDGKATAGLVAGAALLLVIAGLRLGSSGISSSHALKDVVNQLAARVHELEEQQLRQLQQAQHVDETAAVNDKPVTPASSYLDDETNVRIPRGLTASQRLRLLELKVASATGWLKDPFVGFDPKYRDTCKNLSNLSEYGCAEGKDKCGGGYDHAICLDDWSPGQGDCLVYDFGIRENPEFGEVMARTFNCEVHAFDPSPITLKWFPTSEVAKLPNYHFHPYGVAGTDGIIQLHEYDWGQVSIVRDIYPPKQPKDFFNLPVKTLGTIMQELGHEGREIDMLKIDVEGSEFSVLEDALDSLGCLPAKQVTLEWHHYAFDPRYGGGSSPSVNTIVNIMHACGLKMFWRHSTTGWMSPEPRYKEAGLNDIRYNLASFHKPKTLSQKG